MSSFLYADGGGQERDYTAAIGASMRQRRARREQYEAVKATTAGQRAGPPTAPVDGHSATESAA